MSIWETALQTLAGYPPWLIFVVSVVAAVVGIWVLIKVLKWTLYLALIVAASCVVGGLFLWLLG